MWRGKVSMRRISVLIRGLPPGAGFHRVRGGDMAWSPEERATREGCWLVERATILGATNGKGKPSPQPKPPEEGWYEKSQRMRRKEARAVERLRRKAEEVRKRLEADAEGTNN